MSEWLFCLAVFGCFAVGLLFLEWRYERATTSHLRDSLKRCQESVNVERAKVRAAIQAKVDAERVSEAAVRGLRAHCPTDVLLDALDPKDASVG